MGIFSRFFNNTVVTERMQMVTERGNGFYSWGGNVYQSDIVRACIRPKAKAVGKLLAKHIRNNESGIVTNPDVYMRFLLEEPNPYMSGQVMQEKVATQLMLNGNAFILILRDEYGMPAELYPVPASGVEAKYINNILHLRFYLKNGKVLEYPYQDIIHLREDFSENDIFGENPMPALTPLMDIVSTADQGIVKAIKNGSAIRWLLHYKTALKPEDIKKRTNDFVEAFLDTNESNGVAAGVDASTEAQQIAPNDYVPNAAQTDRTTQRIYAFFNTNEKIVTSSANEDEWNSYYELQIEPLAIQMKNEYTRKLFTRKQRSFGNYITFDASNLACASISTKLALQAMVDRGALTPNEWRDCFNLAPVDGGDVPLRRLDTITVSD